MEKPLSLDLEIDGALDAFETKREEKWDDAEAASEINGIADRIADLVFESATTLRTNVDHRAWRNVAAAVAEKLGLENELNEALQLKVARAFFVNTSLMARRSLELVELSLRIEPSVQVQRFLAATARTYILGLAGECSIMCRAAVENALNERYEIESVPIPLDGKQQSPFRLKVSTAVERGWLAMARGKDAREVWQRGSKSAHADPTLVTKTLETVTMSVGVLEELYPTSLLG